MFSKQWEYLTLLEQLEKDDKNVHEKIREIEHVMDIIEIKKMI